MQRQCRDLRQRLSVHSRQSDRTEDHAINWWIAHNRIYNAHAWFSLDGVGGGPIYIFGNVGWFDDKPSRECVPADWAADRTLQADGYAPTSENECSRSRTGKVMKLGPGEIELTEPVYAFNNSWYIRAPSSKEGPRVSARGTTRRCSAIRTSSRRDVCRRVSGRGELRAIETRHDGFGAQSFPFGVGCRAVRRLLRHRSWRRREQRHQQSPRLSDKLAALGYPVRGIHGDPGFVDPTAGDFRLRPDSLRAERVAT
jgi:hypothetical protein